MAPSLSLKTSPRWLRRLSHGELKPQLITPYVKSYANQRNTLSGLDIWTSSDDSRRYKAAALQNLAITPIRGMRHGRDVQDAQVQLQQSGGQRICSGDVLIMLALEARARQGLIPPER